MLDQNIEVTETKLGNIASVKQEDAQKYAENIVKSKKKKGMYDCYRYYVDETDDGYRVLFVDCSRDLKNSEILRREVPESACRLPRQS